jgi:hypothetical protein
MRSATFGLAAGSPYSRQQYGIGAAPDALVSRGDPPIHVSRTTSCAFAANVLNRVYNGPVQRDGTTRTIFVRSPVTRRSYRLRVMRHLHYVTATGPNGIWIRFYYDAP